MRIRRLMMAEGDAGSGGQQYQEPQDNDSSAALSAKETALKAAQEKLQALEKKEADRIKAEKKAAQDKQQLDADQTAKALKDAQEKLDALEKQAAMYQERENQRLETIVAKMPKEQQDKLAGLKEKFGFDAYVEMVETLASTTTQTQQNDFAPPAGSAARNGNNGMYQLTPKAQEILDNMSGDHTAVLKYLKVTKERDDETGQVRNKFAPIVKDFFANMRKVNAKHLSRKDADKV